MPCILIPVIVTHTIDELHGALAQLPGKRGLVMTMGALHAGHLSLVEKAKAECDHVVVSIYVNPLQFGPNEDFEAYPRDLAADTALLRGAGVDVVFAPTDHVMYPRTPLVRIDPGPVATILEGTTRPTHFAGVLQVVHKVFNLTCPDVAYFGQKDAQQLALIRTMVADLDMPLIIRGVPIKREESGLALSSRNVYLSDAEREDALALSATLRAACEALAAGATLREVLDLAATRFEASNLRLDYFAVVDRDTFRPLALLGHPMPEWASDGETGTASSTISPETLLCAAAAWAGTTRLIDNMEASCANAQ